MLLEEMMRKEREQGLKTGLSKGRKEGISTGRKAAKAESVLIVLDTKGAITPELRARIESEKDLDKLSKWLLLAVSVSTPEEFAQKM